MLRHALQCLVIALTLTGSDMAQAQESWPRWEAGSQFSLISAGGMTNVRAEAGISRFFFTRHALELRGGVSHLLSATALDLDGSYALHLRWCRLLGFARVGAGLRFEQVGGGHRSRLAVFGGGGVKIRLGSMLALRLELTGRHLIGAPGVADELALLVGPVALWN
ncbi:MAG: hypothetical protein JRH20_08565 [Deltaproteobacteria bacterium]|nr:hypothetical protein [Deltaproteobacteria bacterium]